MKLKSNQVKELSGTFRESRVKKIYPSVIGNSIFPLNKNENKIYHLLKEHLQTNNAGKEIDAVYLSLAARIIDQLIINSNTLAAASSVMVYPNGAKQISAEFTAFRQSVEMFKDVSKTLGLDPRSRLSMDYFINEIDDEEDPFAHFFQNN